MLALNGMIRDMKLGRAFFGLVKDPHATHQVFEMAELALSNPDQSGVDAIAGFVMSQPGFAEQYEAKYQPAPMLLEDLSDLPRGTLGREYYEHMSKNGLKPDFFPILEMNTPAKYMAMRGRQSHDVWHVLAGYDTSVQDEIALQAFTFAQTHSGISVSILSAGLLHYLKNHPAETQVLLEAIFEGYQRGKRARFLMTEKWEDRWAEPLESLRAKLNIAIPAASL
jgi:ubiquinone biosynthesis protein Coq4